MDKRKSIDKFLGKKTLHYYSFDKKPYSSENAMETSKESPHLQFQTPTSNNYLPSHK